MKPLSTIIISTAAGLLVAGLIFLAAAPPRGEMIQLSVPPTPAPILVDIQGAVNQPGVVSLPAGSHVVDALLAAGGMAEDAAEGKLNQASALRDGMLVYVPRVGEVYTPPAGSDGTVSSGADRLVNINIATLEELITLPGIGETKAQAVIDYRNVNGLFLDITEIQNVPGIGPSLYEGVKDQITVGT